MCKVIRFLQSRINKHRIVWRAMGALSLGILLGTLVAMPIDQAFGFSAPPYTRQLYTALRSLVATATLFRVWAVDRTELVVGIEHLSTGEKWCKVVANHAASNAIHSSYERNTIQCRTTSA